jgi:hypothetical protein
MTERLISVPAAKHFVQTVIADPILQATINNILDGLVAVDAVPVVHGRWEDFCGDKMCCCSVCKAEFDNTCNEIHGEWCYCPNCGARMDLEV